MSPEFGATSTLFPIDDETLAYLRLTGRTRERVALVERYAKDQGLWREPGPGPDFDALLTLDLSTVDPSVAGPRRPQDRVTLPDLPANFHGAFPHTGPAGGPVNANPGRGRWRARRDRPRFGRDRGDHVLHEHLEPDGDGRRRAAGQERGGARAHGGRDGQDIPRSRLQGGHRLPGGAAGWMAPLAQLGFALAGYGCTTCIGNSGPLDAPVVEAIEEHESSRRPCYRVTGTSKAADRI